MKTLIFIFIFILFNTFIYAQTTIPGGNVSGLWTVAGSPYLVQGNITIPSGSTLNIEPAVVVEFQGSYGLTVSGYLEAVGTETDSIHFVPADTTAGWTGIYFAGGPDTSHLVYCTISNCSSPVACLFSSPVISHSTITYGENCAIQVILMGSPEISHCTIMYNQSGISWESPDDGTISNCIISHNGNGGGIRLYGYAELTLIDCIINDNTNPNPGGGVYCDLGTLTVINCTISGNSSQDVHGGGVACVSGTHTFTNCTINGNHGDNSATFTNGGGGISFYNASGALSYCTIFDNSSGEYGGGIAITNGNLAIDHCTIDGNFTVWGPQSGISIVGGSTVAITNSIISNNYGGYGIYNSGTLTVGNTDFFSNTTGAISGNIPTSFGELTTVNTNGDSCDVYSNIFMDPLYVDQVNFDLHLTEDSPCIDAGNPAFPLDPDGTIADMGAYYYHQTIPPDPPQNVTIEIIGTEVHISWDAVTGANYYIVYSSDDPYTGFTEDTSGTFIGESWSTSIINEKRFYYVKALN